MARGIAFCVSIFLGCSGGGTTSTAGDGETSTGTPPSSADTTDGPEPTTTPTVGTTDGAIGSTSGDDATGTSSTTTTTNDASSGEPITSTTGGSTETGTSGAADSSGGTTSSATCEAMVDCFDCFACATADGAYCQPQKAGCEGDADCAAIAACVAGCPDLNDPDFEACYDGCLDSGTNNGVMLFEALGGCLACDTCQCQRGLHPEC